MSEQIRIKLVEGSTYGCPQFPREDKTLKRGESILVDAALGEKLLQDFYTDKAGKERHYFEDVTDEPEESQDDTGGEGAQTSPRRSAPVKTATRKRS